LKIKVIVPGVYQRGSVLDNSTMNRGIPVRTLSVYDPRLRMKRMIVLVDTGVTVGMAFFFLFFFIFYMDIPWVGVVLFISFLIMSVFGYIVLDHALALSGKEITIYSNGVQFPTTRFTRLFHTKTFVSKDRIRKVRIGPSMATSADKNVKPMMGERTAILFLVLEKYQNNTSDRRFSEVKAVAEWMAKEWKIPVEGSDVLMESDRPSIAKTSDPTPDDNFCTTCGKEREQGMSYCNSCGQRFEH
jgi:hypothetical protein